MANGDAELIPPGEETELDDVEELNSDRALVGHTAALRTIGQVKSEMGKVYRRARNSKITWEEATKAIWVLRGILSAIDTEEKYRVPDDDDDQRPVFTGLRLVGPTDKPLVGPDGSPLTQAQVDALFRATLALQPPKGNDDVEDGTGSAGKETQD